MNCIITSKAREYIRNKDGTATIRLDKKQTGCSCCGESEVEIPSIKLGAPQAEPGKYQKVIVMDVELYVHFSIQSALEQITPEIDVESTFFGKKLVLYGFKQE